MAAPHENIPKARQAALTALALDEEQSMAHGVLGAIELYFDWNWVGAEKEFERALELNPNDYYARITYPRLLLTLGGGTKL